jgi:prolyl-tRNA editing enzyme YbaK/EbsC (Cys-tRNA(Pro) deacylase)
MAIGQELLGITGYAIGTVSPFGLLRPLRMLADVSVFKPEEISFGSGLRGVATLMKSGDFQRALGKIELGQFC